MRFEKGGSLLAIIVSTLLVLSLVTLYFYKQNISNHEIVSKPEKIVSVPVQGVKLQINSLEPTDGLSISTIIISGSGFQKDDNIINFGSDFLGGYESTDGAHIEFRVPWGLRRGCVEPTPDSFKRHNGNPICDDYTGYPLESGSYPIAVINSAGKSNFVAFNLVSLENGGVISKSDEVKFDPCGPVSNYKNKNWYPDLVKAINKFGISLEAINDMCVALNDPLVIFIIPIGYSKPSLIFEFNLATGALSQAKLNDKGRGFMASTGQFGEREGKVIHLKAGTGDGGCMAEMYYDFHYLENILEFTKEYGSCEPDNIGEWTYY